jgi:hypothetical protein
MNQLDIWQNGTVPLRDIAGLSLNLHGGGLPQAIGANVEKKLPQRRSIRISRTRRVFKVLFTD